MKLNEYGKIIQETWLTLPQYFTDILLDEFVIMPNHFHGIILISHRRGLINQTPTINQTLTKENKETPEENNKKWILMKNAKTPLGKIIRHFKAKSS